MKNILDAYREIIIDLFLTSMLLFMVFTLGFVGKSALSNKQEIDVQTKDITNYREIYMYDDSVITGNDIIMLILKYGDLYSYYFELPDGDIAIRPICIYEENEDYLEHVHSTNKDKPCVKGWYVDDLGSMNSLMYNESTGEVTAVGCEGGISTDNRDTVYTSKTITDILGGEATDLFDCTIRRFNYDYFTSTITDEDLLKEYDRRKNDIIGFTFKLK